MTEDVGSSRQGLVKKQRLTEAELAEVEELARICDAYEDLRLRFGVEPMRTRTDHETNDFLYFVDDRLVGVLMLSDYGHEERELTGMVHPDYRRKGIASQLLAGVREEGKKRGIQRLVLVSERFSHSGRAFVEAVGAQYDASEHHMVLEDFQERGNFPEQLQLVRATPQDVDVIAYITAASFGDAEERIKPHIARDLLAPNREYYIARLGQEPVGSFNLFMSHDSYGIYAFGVPPQYRRRGFGRQMLEQIIKKIQAESQKRITLEVDTNNTNAIALYQSCGFRPVTTYGYYGLNV
jgi:ribosomal protein S18 acetylase RimI-like enzyme